MKIKSIILLALFVAAFSFSAEAQLGGLLNKAKDKAKEAATKEAKKTAEKKAEQVVDKAETSVSETSENVQLEVKNATATDIDTMLGVSMSALNESYKNLSNIYLWQTKGIPGAYFTKSGMQTLIEQQPYRQLILWMMVSGEDAPCLMFEPKPHAFCVVPADAIINANFAVFQAFPAVTYPLFMEARMLIRAMEEGRIRLDYENPNTLIAFLEDDKIYFKKSEYADRFGFGLKNSFIEGAPTGNDGEDKLKKLVHWKAEEARLMELYKKHVPFKNVKNTFINTMVTTVERSKEKDWFNGVYESFKLVILAEDMQSHPNKVEDQDYKDALESYENLKTNNYPKWEAFMKKQWMELYAKIKEDIGDGTVEIPKAAISNPKLEAEMIAIAKTIYEDGRVPVKAIIKNPDWTITRNAFGVIIDRFQTAYIIFKMTDGTHRMVDIGFKQLYNGSSYGKTQLRGIGLVNDAVKYGN